MMRPTLLALGCLLTLGCASGEGPVDSDERADQQACAAAAIDEHGFCRGADGRFANASCCDIAQAATCTMTRLDSIPAGPPSATATVAAEEGEFADSDGLNAFHANYSFSVEFVDDGVSVFFFENMHVQDEVGDLFCEVPDDGSVFCNEPIEVNEFLGSGDESEPHRQVEAFDFSCEGTDTIACTMTRRPDVSPGPAQAVATVELAEGAFADSTDVNAFAANYSFGVEVVDDELHVVFFENAHIQDEVGDRGCAVGARGEGFCQEPIFVDPATGTEDAPDSVQAFDFNCVIGDAAAPTN